MLCILCSGTCISSVTQKLQALINRLPNDEVTAAIMEVSMGNIKLSRELIKLYATSLLHTADCGLQTIHADTVHVVCMSASAGSPRLPFDATADPLMHRCLQTLLAFAAGDTVKQTHAIRVGVTFLQGCKGVLELYGQKFPPRGSPASYTLSCTLNGLAGIIVSGA